MTSLGEVKLYFTEALKSIDEFENLNLTAISNNNSFNILYQTYVMSKEFSVSEFYEQNLSEKNDKNNSPPELYDWWVKNFTNNHIVFQLNFTEEYKVSTGD